MAGRPPNPIGPAGTSIAENLARIRAAKRIGYAELSRRLSAAGWPLPVLALRRIEKRERRVDVDDLLALATVLEVSLTTLIPALESEHRCEAVDQLAAVRALLHEEDR